MSKGHMEALANLKAMRAAGIIGVTKHAVTKSTGRPKLHANLADKQKAYRDRKSAAAKSKA